MLGRGIDLAEVRWNVYCWFFDWRGVICGVAVMAVIVATLGVVTADVITQPTVQLETGTGKLVGVVTSDGVRHSPAYFFENDINEYDLEYVAPGY